MNLVGLGKCGCNIVKCFEQYSEYNCFYVNTEKVDDYQTIIIKKQKTHEEYEKNFPNIKKHFKDVDGPVFIFLGGSGAISGSSLRLLECFKGKNPCVFYTRPEKSLLSENGVLIDRAVYNILQEYSRSGAIGPITILDNPTLEDMIQDITIMNRWEKINNLISSTFHMINVFDNQVPVLDNLHPFSDIGLIRTIGIFEYEKGEENLFFSLDNILEKRYYYAIPRTQLETDTKLLKKITEQMKEESMSGKVKISHAVYPTSYDQSFCYVVCSSSKIQK